MVDHPPIKVLLVSGDPIPALARLKSYLRSMPHVRVNTAPELPEDLSAYGVVVTLNAALETEPLHSFVQAGGGWLALFHLSTQTLPELAGVQPQPVGVSAELRVLFKDPDHPLAERLPEAVYLPGRFQALKINTEDCNTLLYADWHYQHAPVMTLRAVGEGRVACTTLQAYHHPCFQRILYRVMRHLAGHPCRGQELGIGLLGYPPWLGRLHGSGVEQTSGLKLVGVCDLNPVRERRAQQTFPYLKCQPSAAELAADPDIDLVIVATPPDTHAKLSVQMMEAGKHVICEKPLALTRQQADGMVAAAERWGLHLSCHQNRRWDQDYLAIKQALHKGLLGELFYMETFVGGFNHPCGYWHSHAAIAGGTCYDWGGHYLDWIVSLMPEQVTSVVGTAHKRVWHDVTNADQERIQLRFAGGQEAEFLHSDIAAWRKPKWYLLGTQAALVGQWRDATTFTQDPLQYYQQYEIPATEMLPDLTLHRRESSGQVVARNLAVPERRPFLFHGNLADHLLNGEPLAAPLNDSVTVVTILEAASRSAARGGTVEELHGD